jgi:hypothetical protein
MIKETVTKAVITGVIGGLIAISGVQLFIVPQLKAKDLSVSDELYRLENKIDSIYTVKGQNGVREFTNQVFQSGREIESILQAQQAQQPK